MPLVKAFLLLLRFKRESRAVRGCFEEDTVCAKEKAQQVSKMPPRTPRVEGIFLCRSRTGTSSQHWTRGYKCNHTTADPLPWGWEQGEPNWMTVGHKQQDVAVFLYCHPNQSWKQEMKKCILCLVFDIEISLFLILSLRNLLWSAILVSQALGWKQWVLFPNTFSSSIETQLTCVMSSRKGH